MRYPDFLIIGAMKAGTTTLYRDLLSNPAVFMPADKEPESLLDDSVLGEEGRRAYARLFERARPDQRCGEASTSYTKLPGRRGVPTRALDVCGPDLKLIYMVREPVSRIISHHHHAFSSGAIPIADINEAVRAAPELIDWTRYAMQARPWLEAFGEENLLILKFEGYIRDRRQGITDLSHWLGIEPRPELVNVEAVFNRSEGKPVAGDTLRRVARGSVYRRFLRPLLSQGLRDRLRGLFLPKAPSRPNPPSPETVDFILETLADDLDDLRTLMGLSEPVWDIDAIRRKHAPGEPTAEGVAA